MIWCCSARRSKNSKEEEEEDQEQEQEADKEKGKHTHTQTNTNNYTLSHTLEQLHETLSNTDKQTHVRQEDTFQ